MAAIVPQLLLKTLLKLILHTCVKQEYQLDPENNYLFKCLYPKEKEAREEGNDTPLPETCLRNDTRINPKLSQSGPFLLTWLSLD